MSYCCNNVNVELNNSTIFHTNEKHVGFDNILLSSTQVDNGVYGHVKKSILDHLLILAVWDQKSSLQLTNAQKSVERTKSSRVRNDHAYLTQNAQA